MIQSQEYFTTIGEFIFRFSQLEYLIKSALAGYPKLRGSQFDVIVVAEKTIKLDFDAVFHPALKAFFNKCRKPNQEVRVVVAHGSWSTEGARYSRWTCYDVGGCIVE